MSERGSDVVIRYGGDGSTAIWKHPLESFSQGANIVVHNSQEAIIYCNGKMVESYEAGEHALPYMRSCDVVEIYFVNKIVQMGVKWGTDSPISMFDAASSIHIQLGAHGNFNLKVVDARKLLSELIAAMNDEGTMSMSVMSMIWKLKPMLINCVKSNFVRVVKENQINILGVDEFIDVISIHLCKCINEQLEKFGVVVTEFVITEVKLPLDDPNFRKLREQYAEKTLKSRNEEINLSLAQQEQMRLILEAETKARMNIIDAQGKAEASKILASVNEMLGWNCVCGEKNISSKFCPECGAKNPALNKWTCSKCGTTGIVSKFCPECGAKRESN